MVVWSLIQNAFMQCCKGAAWPKIKSMNTDFLMQYDFLVLYKYIEKLKQPAEKLRLCHILCYTLAHYEFFQGHAVTPRPI